MKFFSLSLLLILTLAGISTGQTSTVSNNPTDVDVIKVKWGKFSDIAPGGNLLFDTSSKANPMTQDAVVGSSKYQAPTPDDYLLNNPRPGQGISGKWPRPVGRNSYLYQATIKNRGSKIIHALKWEYIFTNSRDRSVVARYQFYTAVKIPPGKEKKLGALSAPPYKISKDKAVAKDIKKMVEEQVLITGIEYADGTVWKRPYR